MAQTGEMQFGGEPVGIFLTHDDVQRYFGALHMMIHDRRDPISTDTVMELLEVLREAEADEVVEVQKLKPYEACLDGLQGS